MAPQPGLGNHSPVVLKPPKGLVSVVIPMFNAERWIGDALRGLLSQTYKTWELIVVDDGSVDSSIDVVRHIAADHLDQVLFIRTTNHGVSAARNRGMRQANGEYIALLDADDVWVPEKIELQVSSLLEQPEALACGCGYVMVDDELEVRIRSVVPSWTIKSIQSWLLLNDRGTLLPSTILMRRQVLDKVGFFSERLSTAADLDYSWRLVNSGSITTRSECLVQYRLTPGQMHRDMLALQRDYDVLFETVDILADTNLQNQIRGRLKLLAHFRAARAGNSSLIGLPLFDILVNHPKLLRYLLSRQILTRLLTRETYRQR